MSFSCRPSLASGLIYVVLIHAAAAAHHRHTILKESALAQDMQDSSVVTRQGRTTFPYEHGIAARYSLLEEEEEEEEEKD